VLNAHTFYYVLLLLHNAISLSALKHALCHPQVSYQNRQNNCGERGQDGHFLGRKTAAYDMTN